MVPLGYTLLELSEEIEFKLKICIILSSSLNGFYNKFQHQLLLNPRKLPPTIYTPSSMRVFKYWITTLTMRFISFCIESSNAYWRCSRARGWGTKILWSLCCKFRQKLMSAWINECMLLVWFSAVIQTTHQCRRYHSPLFALI